MKAIATDLAHYRLDNDYSYFARQILKIQDKAGFVVPFVFNSAQEFLHKKLEAQLHDKGRIRALVLKGRQQGCSTYVEGRFYHKCTRKKNKRAFILSHESETTQKLLDMVELYYEESPEVARPKRDTANRRRLEFKEIRSQYTVGTAGNEKIGRGGTIQLFHGSEVGFWEKVEGLETGILQSVSEDKDTEIILESTANGMNNFFFRKCMEAMEGVGDYILVFIPWFWQNEYRREDPPDGNTGYHNNEKFGDEEEQTKLYSLDKQQIYWRRGKIIDLKTLWMFKQEYPSYVMEAFQTSGETLIDPEFIMKARKSTIKDPQAPLVIGVDPGRTKDRTIIARRRGRELLPIQQLPFEKGEEEIQMQIAGRIARIIDTERPVRVFIDVGEGWGVIDRLKERGYGRVVQGIPFGSTPLDDTYLNKRAEIWCLLRDWIQRENGEVSIPDVDEIQKDFMAMPGEKTTSSGKIKMVEKDIIRMKFGMSTDIGDAVGLTFSFPIAVQGTEFGFSNRIRKKNSGKSEITSLRRVRNRTRLRSRRG